MNNRVVLTLAWLTSTVVMMIVTYSAVNLVGSQVTDQPIQANLTADTTIADRVSVEASTTTTSTTLAHGASSTSAPDIPTPSATSSIPSNTSVDTAPPATTPTTSTETSTATPTSTPPAVEVTGPFPVSSGGGVITVSCAGDEISFLGATPSAGYSMRIEEQGPNEVKVKFSSTENEWEVEARCRDGVVDPKVDLEDF